MTNIDDVVLLTLFFAKRVPTRNVVLGQCLGFAGIVALSLAGFWAAVSIPSAWFRFLGLLPLAIGIKHLVETHRIEWKSDTRNTGVVSIAAVTLANGADNIGLRAVLRHQPLACMGYFAGLCSALAALVLGWKMAGKPPACFGLSRPVRTLHRAPRLRGSWDLHPGGGMKPKNSLEACPLF